MIVYILPIPSTSAYRVRIDTRIREMIEEMQDEYWQDEIWTLIGQAVKKKHEKYLLCQARKNQHLEIPGMPAANAIRVDRDTWYGHSPVA